MDEVAFFGCINNERAYDLRAVFHTIQFRFIFQFAWKIVQNCRSKLYHRIMAVLSKKLYRYPSVNSRKQMLFL